MITLASDCLVFELAGGEGVPFSSEMISVELMGNTGEWLEPEFVRHAAKAVFHYFKHELGRQTVTVGEFTEALEKVLKGFKPQPQPPLSKQAVAPSEVLESDLCSLALELGRGCELFFFTRLRDELRLRLRQAPRVLRFKGLRPCVKQLAGTQTWGVRCRNLEDQIVAYLRECLLAEGAKKEIALLVE